MSSDDHDSNVAVAVLVGAMIGAGFGISIDLGISREPFLFWGEFIALGMVVFGLIAYFFGDWMINFIKEYLWRL